MGLAADGGPPVPPAVRPRNRRGEGSHLRADILAAASELLDRGGPAAVTLRAVARRAGIAASSIYPHFPDRPALLSAVVREGLGELADLLAAAVRAVGTDPEQRLYAACHAHLAFATAHPGRYRAMHGEPPARPKDAPADPAAPAGTVDPAAPAPPGAETRRVLAAALAECVRAGRSTSTAPSADALALWLGLHGLAHQRAVTRFFPWPAGDLVRPLVAALSRLHESGK